LNDDPSFATLIDEIELLHRKNRELRAALAPFAEKVRDGSFDLHSPDWANFPVQIGHLRAAAKALEK
jgi:hypothetical protein